MTVTNLPARRTCRPDVTQYQPTDHTAPPAQRRHIGLLDLVLIVLLASFIAGTMLALTNA